MITAIVLAAGSGSRMKNSVKKQYMLLNEKPLVYYSLKAFDDCEEIDNIVIVTGKEEMDYMRINIVDKYGIKKVTDIVEGGKERYHSVYNGLTRVDESGYVLVHDGARPCITKDNIANIINSVKLNGACVAGVPAKDTIKVINENNNIVETPERSKMWLAQTPQAFRADIIKKAYNLMMQSEDDSVTDDSMVVEKYGGTIVKMVECSYNNIKVTTPEDISIAEKFLQDK